MHHSLGDGEFGYVCYLSRACYSLAANAVFRMYQKMIKHLTVADTVLDDIDSAASEIDRVLEGKLLVH